MIAEPIPIASAPAPAPAKFKTGVFQMTDAEYFAHPGVSQSSLKALARSPAHYLAAKAAPDEPTPQMKFGTWFDWLIFDREQFEAKTIVKPSTVGDGRTKEGKAFAAEHAGKDIISADQWDALCRMKMALLNKKVALYNEATGTSKTVAIADILARGQTQQCAFAPVSFQGQTIQCKGKIDFVPEPSPETDWLVDLKTTTDASATAFAWKMSDLDYHAQAAFYLDLWKVAAGEARSWFVFIVVETQPPFAVAVYVLNRRAIERGGEVYQARLAKLFECMAKNEWPAYPDRLVEIDLPERVYRGEAA